MTLGEEVIQVLALGCRICDAGSEIEVTEVDSALAALAAIRLMHFDLLLTTTGNAETAVWPLMQKIRRVRPKLHWWLIAHGLSEREEVLARTLGVTRILETFPAADSMRALLPTPHPPARQQARPSLPVASQI